MALNPLRARRSTLDACRRGAEPRERVDDELRFDLGAHEKACRNLGYPKRRRGFVDLQRLRQHLERLGPVPHIIEPHFEHPEAVDQRLTHDRRRRVGVTRLEAVTARAPERLEPRYALISELLPDVKLPLGLAGGTHRIDEGEVHAGATIAEREASSLAGATGAVIRGAGMPEASEPERATAALFTARRLIAAR